LDDFRDPARTVASGTREQLYAGRIHSPVAGSGGGGFDPAAYLGQAGRTIGLRRISSARERHPAMNCAAWLKAVREDKRF